MSVAVGDRVRNIQDPELGEGTVSWAFGKVADVLWLARTDVSAHYQDDLEVLLGGDTESHEIEIGDSMEREYSLDQTVLDIGSGQVGHIVDYVVDDTGPIYTVSWEDGRRTRNVQQALRPAPVTKIAVPTPKDVKDLTVQMATRASTRADLAYDPESVIEAWDLNYSLGNVLKEVYNAGQDGPNEMEALTRAAYFLNRRIEKIQGQGFAA